MIEFTLSTSFIAALLSCMMLPFTHIILKWFIVNFFRKNESSVLLICYLFTVITWLILNSAMKEHFDMPINKIITYDGIFVLGFFFIGYFEFQSLLSRGYTLCILSDLFSINKSMTVQQIAGNYGGGKGLKWFLDKRLKGLKYLGLIREEKGKIKLTNRTGKTVSIILSFSKKILMIERSG